MNRGWPSGWWAWVVRTFWNIQNLHLKYLVIFCTCNLMFIFDFIFRQKFFKIKFLNLIVLFYTTFYSEQKLWNQLSGSIVISHDDDSPIKYYFWTQKPPKYYSVNTLCIMQYQQSTVEVTSKVAVVVSICRPIWLFSVGARGM